MFEKQLEILFIIFAVRVVAGVVQDCPLEFIYHVGIRSLLKEALEKRQISRVKLLLQGKNAVIVDVVDVSAKGVCKIEGIVNAIVRI